MISSALCIGNGEVDADKQAKIYSLKNKLQYNGLLDTTVDAPTGCYHTSIHDLSVTDIENLAKVFDRIVVLPNDASTYKTDDDYVITMALANRLQSAHQSVLFLNQGHETKVFDELTPNRSVCIFPFIGMLKHNKSMMPCCWWSNGPITNSDENFDFVSNDKYSDIRQRMISGEIIPQCSYCTFLESMGATSPRIVNTSEWAIRLNIPSVTAMPTKLVYYDIRLGNKCNLMCRTCSPEFSNLIDREYFEINLTTKQLGLVEYNNFDVIDLTTVARLYVAGGEPTINDDFINFLNTCVSAGRTDFEIVINTNCISVTDDFLNLIKHFSKVKFELSVDGFDRVNQYIRWPSKWEKVVQNIERIVSVVGSRISFNSVVSIYNAGTLYDLFSWLDATYPSAEKHISLPVDPAHILIEKHPNKDIIYADLDKLRLLTYYQNTPTFSSRVESIRKIVDSYVPTDSEIRSFFDWNDKLDKSRGIKLADYIPALERQRPK